MINKLYKQITNSKLLANSGILVVSNVFGKMTNFLLLPFFTHVFTPFELGEIFTLQVMTSLMLIFIPLSLNSSFTRFYYDKKLKSEQNVLYSSLYFLVLCLSFVYCSFMYFYALEIAQFLEVSKKIYVEIVILNLFLGSTFSLLTAKSIVEENVKPIAISVLLSNMLLLASNIVLINNMNDGILGYLYSYSLFYLLQFILTIVFSFNSIVSKVSVKDIVDSIHYGRKYLWSEISGWIVNFSDRIMILKLTNQAGVGYYSTGYSVGFIPGLIVNSFNQVYAPLCYKSFSKNSIVGPKFLTYVVLFVYSVLFSGFLSVLSVLILVLGPDYKNVYWVSVIVSLAYFANSIRMVYHNPMSYDVKMVGKRSSIWVFVALSNVILNYFFISWFGYFGAAISTFISFCLSLPPTIYYSQKAIKINYQIELIVLIILPVIFSFLVLIALAYSEMDLIYSLLLIPLNSIYYYYLFIKRINRILQFVKVHV